MLLCFTYFSFRPVNPPSVAGRFIKKLIINEFNP